MHNLEVNFDKILTIAKDLLAKRLNKFENLCCYRHKPKMSDLGIIAMSICAEALGVDSENHLYSKLKSDYPSLYCKLPHRTNYNRRRRRLVDEIDHISVQISDLLNKDCKTFLIDSMPVPICRHVRSKALKIMKEDPDLLPKAGYSAIDKRYYTGYKLHVVESEYGVIQSFSLSSANVHDVKLLDDLSQNFIEKCTLIGDKGYITKQGQLRLFETREIELLTAPRCNQQKEQKWTWVHRKKRKRIETTFSQFCDQFMIKRNYAKKVNGLYTRIVSKIAAFTMLQYINSLNNKPLNHINMLWHFNRTTGRRL